MIVVSDTSALTNLAAIGRFELLRAVFGEVHIPRAVWDELNADGKRWPGAEEVDRAAWVHRHDVKNLALVRSLARELDDGEAEGIALAVELDADLVLIDERDGRRAAQQMGLKVAGIVAVLVSAKKSGLIDSLHHDLTALIEIAGFRVGKDVIQAALLAAGEASTTDK